MDLEEFRTYCLSKPAVSESFPFDNRTLVFKVAGKIFVLTDVECYDSVNLKCNPEMAIELREKYAFIIPGYHMNKKHWNTVLLNGEISSVLLKELVDHSYSLVVQNLPKKIRDEFALG
jgi:predicted DNA-binding protein (MmcQ/YjbR family)